MTIIDERYEYFQDHLDDIVGHFGWTDNTKDLIRDAYLVDISPAWTQAQLLENRGGEIYIRIIQRCRIMQSLLPDNKKGNDILLAEQLNNISQYYRRELLNHLTALVREYCL